LAIDWPTAPLPNYVPTGENSDVSPVARLVAVAVTTMPRGMDATGAVNDSTPLALVVTLMAPRNNCPWFGVSLAGVAKNSIRNRVLGTLVSFPETL
jgi:hypothetical protein